MKTKKYKILLVLFLISFISASLLLANLLRHSDLICNETEGCFTVSESPYSETLGIENEYLGFVFFLAMIILTIMQIKKSNDKREKWIKIGIVIGGIWAVYSLYLMEFVIMAYCKYCTVIDISSIIAVGVYFFYKDG